MAVNTRIIRATPEEVFAVLADGWLFPTWVVGASRMRSVDERWPHVGAQLHHSFGVWPAVIDDRTTSLQWNPPHSFVIQPKGWPLGEARVTLEAEPHGRGARVLIREKAVKGPGTLVPAPLMWLLLRIRNHEALRRLGHMAEGGAGAPLAGRHEPSESDRRAPSEPRHPLRTAVLIGGAALAVAAAALRIARH